MTYNSSQNFESYVPVYDVVPEGWEDARGFITEQLKKIANAVNIREIGWYLDDEILTGKPFIPGVLSAGNTTPAQYRQILRKVVELGPLVAGLNAGVLHGITFDARFTLIQIWVSGTDHTGFTARTISGNDVVMNAVNIIVTSPQAFDYSVCVIEYIKEL